MKNNKDKESVNKYLHYSGLGFQMIASIGAFTWLGYYLDERKGNESLIFTAILSLIGVALSIYIVIRSVTSKNKGDS